MVNKKVLSAAIVSLTIMLAMVSSVMASVSCSADFDSTCVPTSDIIEPDSEVLYFTQQDGVSERVDCADGWAAVGYDDVQVHGVASDEGAGDSKIVDIKYKKGTLNWNIANWEKPEDISEQWWSLVQDPALKEGETRYCAKATDSAGNEERLNESDDCCVVCVDLSEPKQASKPEGLKGECDEEYVNTKELIWNWEGNDEGCSGIVKYDVLVDMSDGENSSEMSSETGKAKYSFSGEDGKAYRIRVRGVDKAGNTGEWSEYSDWIHIDLTAPTVEIKKPGYTWLNDDFELVEEDMDANLWECYYQIENNESDVFVITKESEEVECNTPVTIDVSEYCPEEGENKCRVYKVVKDKACNDDSSYRTFDIDTQKPATKKFIDGEEFDAEKHEFVKATSVFTLNCEDSASGCKETKYRITYEDAEELSADDDWTNGNTFMLDQGDGVYTVEFYSVDNAKNEEEVTMQEHTVDSTAPVTTKYVDGHVATEEDYFFTEQVTFTFECADEMSECETYFELTYPDGTSEEFSYSETGPFVLDGEHGDGAYHIKFWSVDEAGNVETAKEQDHVRDILAPVTTKSVEGYSYGEDFMFVRSDTGFILMCDDDGGSGCKETNFMITRPDESSSGLQTYVEGFSLGNESGLYRLMFWSVDNVGHAETPTEQEHVIDNDAPVTTKTIEGSYYDEVNDINWVSGSSEFNLECNDNVKGVGCAETRYRINGGEWIVGEEFSLTGESGEYFIEYQSEDHLYNVEDIKNQTDKLDNSAPALYILNPFYEENITLCSQAIVVEASDDESGIAEVIAELVDSEGEVVKTSNLVRTATGTWEAYMDKKIKPGKYVLRVTARDNVGNEVVNEVVENVLPTVYVTGFENPQCEVDSNDGGNCSFKVNVCIRGANAIKLMMEKIDGVVTPSSMNARISKDENEALVGLTETQSQLLTLGDEEINDVVQFDWKMNMPSGIGELIGVGSHKIKYHIRSFMEETEK